MDSDQHSQPPRAKKPALGPRPCSACCGTMRDPEGVWQTIDGCGLDWCRDCNGTGRDLKAPPCMECGAMTLEEAHKKCNCTGDKDHCHGCEIWPDDE